MNDNRKTIRIYLGDWSWVIDPVLLICVFNMLFDMQIKFTIWTYCASFVLLALAKRYCSGYRPPNTAFEEGEKSAIENN